MKNASPNAVAVANNRISKGRTIPVLVFFILIIVFSGSKITQPVAADPLTSSLITQIRFDPTNQPANFTVGQSNPATQPMRIQTINASGVGENVTGAGFTVFIVLSTTSPTGRFAASAAGPFNQSTLTVTITSGRQFSQDFFYRDTTPGTVVLDGSVTIAANTLLKVGQIARVVKSVLPIGVGRLTFGTQPANANKDATIAPFSVRVEDVAGNLDATSSRSVSLAIGNNLSGGTLSGTSTVAAVNGIATFNDLSIDRAGNGYTLVASSATPAPALTTATSLPFNISKLDQSINFSELEDKTYGDDDFDVSASASFGKQVSFESRSPETCSVSNSLVHILGAGVCTIRASLSGDADHNDAADVDRSFMINKADAVVVVQPYDVVYNGQPHTTTLVSITGVKGETNEEVGDVDLSETIHVNAGAYENNAWSFTGNGNYNDASGSVANNISKASVTAHAGGGTATYDGSQKTPSSCSISGPGYLGDLTCTNDPANTGPNAGTYVIGSTVNGTGLSNFEIAKSNGTFVIEKATTGLSIAFEAGPYVYRGSAFIANARVTGTNGLDQSTPVVLSGDCLNVTNPNGCVAMSEFAENGNYFGSFGSASITIAKRILDVTASSHVVGFGEPVPTITSSFEGFAAGENASAIDSLPSCATTYVVGSPIGVYPTICSGGSDNNYSFENYVAGSVTVNAAVTSFDGFMSPVRGSNSGSNRNGAGGRFEAPLRTFKLNSTIPFKFTASCSDSPLTTGVHTLSAQKYVNGVAVGGNALLSSKDGPRFRYNDDHWQLNVKTKDLGEGAEGTWLFEVTLFDGSKYSVWLAIRK
jgi:hypothetical protein